MIFTTNNSTPRAPQHLSKQRKKLWRHIADSYALQPRHFELLRLLCEALDRAEQARELLDREGLTILNRYGGQTAHPCVAIERDARVAAARLLRELGLEDE